MQSLQKLYRNNLVDGLNFDNTNDVEFCETCVNGKQSRTVFRSTGGNRAAEPLDLVHSNVCGKMNATSLGGAEYFLTFIDDRTHYTWIYILQHKSEVFDCFLQWKALAEKSSGRKLKAIRTDNGGEFTSAKFVDYLKSEGIRHERTVPKTPQQIGVAEWMNRTLIETMLTHAQIPHSFWAEALTTAVYLRNRTPTKAVMDMTPYEAWTGKKPKVSYLRVFGCDAYAHVPKDERGKLIKEVHSCWLRGQDQRVSAL